MTATACVAPLGDGILVEYWLGELGDADEARIDEHVLGCTHCSRRLAELVALADGIRSAFKRGTMRAFVTDAFVKDVAEHGTRVREYRVPCDGSVNCSVAPEDELLVARLETPLAGVSRIDALSYLDEGAPEVFADVPFDAASDEVVVTSKIARIRGMPSHRQRIRLVAVDDGGERVIGDYTFNHSARR